MRFVISNDHKFHQAETIPALHQIFFAENGSFEDVFSIQNLIFQPVMLVFWRVTGQTQLVSEEKKRTGVTSFCLFSTPHPCGSVKGKSVKFPSIANRDGIK